MKDDTSQWTRRGLSCRDVTDRASEYLDGRLLSLTKVQVVLHLASCAYCRVYVKQIDLISSALRSLPSAPSIDSESSSPAPTVCRGPRIDYVNEVCRAFDTRAGE